MGLTVAVTGPTGEIGLSTVDALERDPAVSRVVGDGPAPLRPGRARLAKTEYRQGDILDRASVEALVADADVVVHLAYLIMGSREESRRINLDGTRNVFEATVAADRPTRLVYTSSVAAYGYRRDNPVPLTEAIPTRGSAEHYYSEQKAECEAAAAPGHRRHRPRRLRAAAVHRRGPERDRAGRLDAVAPNNRLPAVLRGAAGAVQAVLPLMPDPGCRSSSCTTTTSPTRSCWPSTAPASRATTTWPPTAR